MGTARRAPDTVRLRSRGGLMDPLLAELTTEGALDWAAARWSAEHQAEQGGAMDVALLELDLVDEDTVLRALERLHGLPAATQAEVEAATPLLASWLPEQAARAFGLCPIAEQGGSLIALVETPLGPMVLDEIHDLFGVTLVQRIAPSHQLAQARARVYAAPLDDRQDALLLRLAPRRRAEIVRALAALGRARSLGEAMRVVLGHADPFFEFACFLVSRGGMLRVAALVGSLQQEGTYLPEPAAESAVAAAVVHGGYLLASPADTMAERFFFDALHRPLPKTVFVAPVPGVRGAVLALLAENGGRGVPARWAAELTLLVSRLAPSVGAVRAEPAPTEPNGAEPTGAEPTGAEPALQPSATPPRCEASPPAEAPGLGAGAPLDATSPSDGGITSDVSAPSAVSTPGPGSLGSGAAALVEAVPTTEAAALDVALPADVATPLDVAMPVDVAAHGSSLGRLPPTSDDEAATFDITPAERRALERVRLAATGRGVDVEALVDEWLAAATPAAVGGAAPRSAAPRGAADLDALQGVSAAPLSGAEPAAAAAPVVECTGEGSAAAAAARALAPAPVVAAATGATAASTLAAPLVAQAPAGVVSPQQSAELLVGELTGLFQRLATDLPAQLARGMELAFRELGPRIAAAPGGGATGAASAPTAQGAGASASAELLVVTPAAPKEVASYQSRRARTARVKL